MKKFAFILFLLLLPFAAAQSTWPTPAGNCGSACNSTNINIHDEWDANQGTQNDQITWVNVNMLANVLGQPQLLDAVCYIYDGFGTADSCYFRNPAVMSTCLTASQTFLYPFCNNNPQACSSLGAASQFSFPAQYLAQATGPQRIVAQFYMGCTSSTYTWHRIEDFYHVVDKHQYDCNGLSWSDPDYEGDNNNGWVEISANAIPCAGSEICDQLAVQPSTAAQSTPPSPCRRIQGAACQTTPQCVTGLNCNQGNCCPQTQVWNGVQCGPPCIDIDGDGYGNPGNLACPNGAAADCNDNNSSIHPGAIEICDDTSAGVPIDNNCNNAANCLDSYCNGQNALYYAHPACNGPASSCSGQYCGYHAQNTYLALITCNNGVCSMCGDGTCQTSAQCSESCPGLLPGIQYGGVIPYEHPTNCEQDCCGSASNACVGTGNPNYGGGNVCSSLCEGSNGCSSVQFINACNGLPQSARICKNETHYRQCCQGSPQYCGSSNFCTSGSCNACSTTCDGTCQSSTCFNTDPDCSNTGSVQPCPGVCTIPNGQNEQCECDSDANCPSTHFCNQQAGWDPCLPRNPEFPCSTIGTFSCINGDVQECQPQFGGTSSGYVMVDACSPIEQCDNSTVQLTHQCSPAASSYVQVDDAPLGVPVYKQQGDVVVLRFFGSGNGAAGFDTNAFSIVNGTCALSAGQNTCRLRINAEIGTYTITLGYQVETIEVINDPVTLYITSRTKLFDRYTNEQLTVKAILNKAYDKASTQRSIVYDLDEYVTTEHPIKYASFSGYSLYVLSPYLDTSAYNNEAASRIREKCNQCDTVVIVGDDYVVPQYRHESVMQEGSYWNIINRPYLNMSITYTDAPYTTTKYVPLGDIDDLLATKRYQPIFVIPQALEQQYNQALTTLENTIMMRYLLTGVERIYTEQLGCNNADALKNKLPIIIGTPQTNSILACYNYQNIPENTTTTYRDRNLWDNTNPAIIILTANPDHVQTLAQIMQQGHLPSIRSDSFHIVAITLPFACGIIGNVPGAATCLAIAGGSCIFSGEKYGICGTTTATNTALIILPFGKIAEELKTLTGLQKLLTWAESNPALQQTLTKVINSKTINKMGPFFKPFETMDEQTAQQTLQIMDGWWTQGDDTLALILKRGEILPGRIQKIVAYYSAENEVRTSLIELSSVKGIVESNNRIGSQITESLQRTPRLLGSEAEVVAAARFQNLPNNRVVKEIGRKIRNSAGKDIGEVDIESSVGNTVYLTEIKTTAPPTTNDLVDEINKYYTEITRLSENSPGVAFKVELQTGYDIPGEVQALLQQTFPDLIIRNNDLNINWVIP